MNDFEVLIVAGQREQQRLLSTSLELLEQNFHMTTVPSGEEAFLELGLGRAFDLIITDYMLPGWTGIELINMARQSVPTIKAVLTVDDYSLIEPHLNGLEIEAILEKPLDSGSITNGVELALFGPIEEEEESFYSDEQESGGYPQRKTPGTGLLMENPFGQAPPYDADVIHDLMAPHIHGLGCEAIMFVNWAGDVLVEVGHVNERLRFGELVIFIAKNLKNSAEIATYIGPVPSTTMQYYDGTDYDIFAISVGVHYFVALVFPGDSQKQLGAVMRFRARVIRDIIDSIGVDAVMGTVYEEEEEALPLEQDYMEPEPAAAQVEDEFYDEEDFAPEEEGEIVDIFGIEEEDDGEAVLEFDEFDLDDDLGGDDLGDMDAFWDDAAEDAGKIREDSISMEEAMQMGLLEDLDDADFS